MSFLESRKDWAMKAASRQKARYKDDIPDGMTREEYVESLRRSARETLPTRVSELASRFGFVSGKVFIKHNRSSWGSCGPTGNINLNLNLMRVPAELRDYVILHELCHLTHRNHGPLFHGLLESVCPDHREKQRRLRGWNLL